MMGSKARIPPVSHVYGTRPWEEKENVRSFRTDKPETVLVAGGGIGGLEAAIILKKRGHSPILCESTDKLGGQFLTAGEAPRKEEMKKRRYGNGGKGETPWRGYPHEYSGYSGTYRRNKSAIR